MTSAETNVPRHWVQATLGEICEKPQYGWTTKASESGSVRLLRTTDIAHGPINWEQIPYCLEPPEDLEKYRVHAGDIFISRAGSVGYSALVESEPPVPTVFASYLIRFRPLTDCSPTFLKRFLESPQYWAAVRTEAVGIALKNVNAKKLSRVPVHLPPRPEQDRIVAEIDARLNELQECVQSLETALSALVALKRSVFERSIAEGDEMAVDDVLACIEAGKSFRCQTRPAGPSEWGVIKVSAMTWGEFKPGENKAVLSDTEIDPKWEIKPRDLLLSRANTSAYVGASVLVGECSPHLLLSDKSLRLRPAKGIVPEWLHAALSAPSTRAQISALATGTKDSMRNISQAKLRRIRIRVPPKSAQERIAARIEHQLEAIEQAGLELARARAKCAALEGAILVSAVTGVQPARDHASQHDPDSLQAGRQSRPAKDVRTADTAS